MSSLSPRSLQPTLVPNLNALLDAVQIPFNVDHPSDLTPSLLLAIFESIIGARLPIPPAVRQSRTRDAKARAMLVLLGVLECDILRGSNPDDSVLTEGGVSVDGWADDIGLGEVDPERLADGGWEETIFIGELLCWLARRKGILPRTKHSSTHPHSLYSNHHSYGDDSNLSNSLLLRPSPARTTISPPPSIQDIDHDISTLSHITDIPRHPLVHSPEPSLSLSTTTDLSIRARSVSSHTTVSTTHADDLDVSHDLQMHDPRQMMQDAEDDDDRPPTFRPRCIHELDDPSYIRALGASSFDTTHDFVEKDEQEEDPYAPPTPTPQRVRLTGWIEPVDADAEIAAFAASRSRASLSHLGMEFPSRSAGPSRRRTGAPSPPPTTDLRHVPPPLRHRLPHSRSPSPPSPSHSDIEPFDVSFSTLNNTSTPAKPRPRARPTFSQPSTSESKSGGTRRARSPSYGPSGGGGHASIGRTESRSSVGSAPAPGPTSWSTRKKESERASHVPAPTRMISPPLGSTARTNALLTERARLLTELAALKRARSISGGGASTGTNIGTCGRISIGL